MMGFWSPRTRSLGDAGHPNDPVRIVTAQVLRPDRGEDTLVLLWNDEDALERMLQTHGHDVACVRWRA